MLRRRIDLAPEVVQLWWGSAGETRMLPGVESEESTWEGYPATIVRIRDRAGARVLGKPVGTYVILKLNGLARREEDVFGRAARTLAVELGVLLGLAPGAPVLVVGPGDRAIIPDGIDPKATGQVMVTRHLVEQVPEHFGSSRPVAALVTGVLGTTGVESGELIRVVAETLRPARVIAVDTLVSRSLRRVCHTIQLAGTGTTPDSGVGNARAALNVETPDVPIIAVGIPTIVGATTLTCNVLAEAGKGELNLAAFQDMGSGLIITPKDIDAQVRDLAKVTEYGVDLALHTGLAVGDVELFLS